MDEVRVALLGCGLIGRTHARCIRALKEVDGLKVRPVVAVDRDPERARATAADFGFAHASDDAARSIARDDVNAVWICTPTDAHHALLRDALAHRRAVFCEKPLAHTAAESREMARAVQAAGVPAQIGMVLRYSQLFGALREHLLSGQDGRPMTSVFRDDQCLPIQGFYGSDWRSDVRVAGGGTLIEHSIHDIDLLAWLFGKIRRVWCRGSYFAGHTGIEDVANAVLMFDNGFSASLVSVWHQMPHRRSERRLEVFCEQARLETVGDFYGTFEVERVGGALERREVGTPPTAAPSDDANAPPTDFESDAYLFENRAFVEALLAGRTPAPGLGDAVAAHAVVDALYASIRSGDAVDVE